VFLSYIIFARSVSMKRYYLAIDIGASSGRHILGSVENGRLVTEEVYRFPNGMRIRDGQLCWDYSRLFKEILEGLKRCRGLGKIPVSLGIDTWGVDFVLLDSNDQVLGNTVSYRDTRTQGVDREVGEIIPETDLYARTGIQKQPFNTIYQLWTVREQLKKAKSFLMVPEYLNFLLTGVKKNEYTNATTTGMVNAEQKTWDEEILSLLEYPKELFGQLHMPGEPVGNIFPWIAEEVGFACKVVLPATHDTASAVAGVPLSGDTIYISSGTWSLMGVENDRPILTEKSRLLNYTNEGGVDFRFRYLKNIMGLWMIQEVHRELEGRYSYTELAAMAEAEAEFDSVVDVNSSRYLSPAGMIKEIQAECWETGQKVPETPGQIAQCIFSSLAKSYARSASELSEVCGRKFTRINIVGGGCQNDWLNSLTVKESGLKAFAGPVEATAIGNLAVQMISDAVFGSLSEARRAIVDSFDIREVKI
jgi:rhamnulokinase